MPDHSVTFRGGLGARYVQKQVRKPMRAAYSIWRPIGAPCVRKVRARAIAFTNALRFAAAQRAQRARATRPSMGGGR